MLRNEFSSSFTPIAHGGRRRGRRPVPGVPRLLPGGLPGDAVHRVQRGQGHLPLLRQQVQLLAHHRGPQPGVHLLADAGDHEGGPGALQGQPLPSLQQDLVVGGGGGGGEGRKSGGRREEDIGRRCTNTSRKKNGRWVITEGEIYEKQDNVTD